jgi:hypothetical protein
MAGVGGVAVTVVYVVGMVAVADRLVAATFAVVVAVLVMGDVVLEHALIPVALVVTMSVAIVEVVGVVAVLYCDVPALGSMGVVVVSVRVVVGSAHGWCSSGVGSGNGRLRWADSPPWVNASRAIWAT